MGTALDVDLWGHPLRVRAHVPEAVAALRSALSDHVQDQPAPMGFLLKQPDGPSGLHCLIDRSGLILARARTWQECIAVLAEHLAAFAPAPAGTVRMSMRAVVRGVGTDRTAVLAGFPLLSMPPMVERQLERRGQRVIDRLAVDVTPEGTISLAPLPWPTLRSADPIGHCGSDATGAPIDAVLLPASPGLELKPYQRVALIASTISDLAPAEALDLAESLAGRARAVPMEDGAARRRALEH